MTVPSSQPAENSAPDAAPARTLEDRLGEALRRERHGLIMPLWENLPADRKQPWIERTVSFGTILQSCGLKVVER